MTTAELAAQDQAEAKEREFDRKAQRACIWFLALMAPVVAYAVLACLGWVPALPWTAVAR